jgi:hypothetical protein
MRAAALCVPRKMLKIAPPAFFKGLCGQATQTRMDIIDS